MIGAGHAVFSKFAVKVEKTNIAGKQTCDFPSNPAPAMNALFGALRLYSTSIGINRNMHMLDLSDTVFAVFTGTILCTHWLRHVLCKNKQTNAKWNTALVWLGTEYG